MADLDLERIRARARTLWESDGRQPGREHEHWARARRQIEAEPRADTAHAPAGSGGFSSGLQSGGTKPGGGPGAGFGSIGTGGGSTAGRGSGSAGRRKH